MTGPSYSPQYGPWEPDWSGPYDHMLTESEFLIGASEPKNIFANSGYQKGWTQDYTSPPYPSGYYYREKA